MKRELWDDFGNAIAVLKWSKLDLMNLAYGENPKGIDSTVPQDWAYSHPDELFFAACDCSTPFFDIVDMRHLIPDFIAKKVITMAKILTDSGLRGYQDPDSFGIFVQFEEDIKNYIKQFGKEE